jgi:aminoglycoside phosphotransferase (APT) family kinase protein
MNITDFEEIERAIASHGGIDLKLVSAFEGGASTGAYEAMTEDGSPAVVKVSEDPETTEKMQFAADNLPRLRERGYPAPDVLAFGPLQDGSWFTVFERLDGEPPKELDDQLLDQLIELNELQADSGVEAPNRNWSWWIRATLFEGHAGMFDKAAGASPSSARLMDRLSNIVRPAQHHEMHRRDFVHGDFGPHNVVVRGGRISGVVDWMNFGVGNRAIDLGEVLVAWALLRDEGRPVPADGGARLLNRMRAIAGSEGTIQIVAHQLMAGIAFWRTNGPSEQVEKWVRAGTALIDDVK